MKSVFDEHLKNEHLTDENQRRFSSADLHKINTSAGASMVNRTHRVVRERAKKLEAHRSRVRSLWIPLTICSALLLMICSAVWTVLDSYELTQIGIPDSSDQFLVLVLWFLPVSMALLVMVWFQHMRKRSGEVIR